MEAQDHSEAVRQLAPLSSAEDADSLTTFGKKVHIIHRRGDFRAQPIVREGALANPKIEGHWHTVVEEIKGRAQVEPSPP
jgi:thioredoxin reductase (NADPH)